MRDQFAGQMAISPDKKFVAISFPTYKSRFLGSSATMLFQLYSLPDGRWLATLRGDQNKGARQIALSGAPIIGEMLFSADSRLFLATSWHVRIWDVVTKQVTIVDPLGQLRTEVTADWSPKVASVLYRV